MGSAWNKGLTKDTHPSVKKISQTMKRKGIDNFAKWRIQMKKLGKIKSSYPDLKRNGDLAELLGTTLGDGHIHKFPRSESLRIVTNTNNPGLIKRQASLIEKVFGKKPSVLKRKRSNCVDITIYEKNISKRLGLPTGSKKALEVHVPKWILDNRTYIVRYLRGLYETDGTIAHHEKTYTHKLIFTNKNKTLLRITNRLLRQLGFNPHTSEDKVQVSRKVEVEKLAELLQFRQYDAG